MGHKIAGFLLSLRNRHFLLLDAIALCLTPLLAIILRTDGLEPLVGYLPALILFTALAAPLRIAIFYRLGLYNRLWRYASTGEMVQITKAVLISTVLLAVLFFAVRLPALGLCAGQSLLCGLPRSLPAIDGILVLLAVGGSRLCARLARHYLNGSLADAQARRTLIAGAGDAGALIVREIQNNPHLRLLPVGFVDDDEQKRNTRIHGVPVLGDRYAIPALVAEHDIKQIVIAMPTAPGRAIREIVEICRQTGVAVKTMPGVYEILDGTVPVGQLREVRIEDLLRRAPVRTDITAVQSLIAGKRVLVTGAGGSIGSELCRQVLRCRPETLVIAGHGETSIFTIYHELKPVSETVTIAGNGHIITQVAPVIVDVRMGDRLRAVLQAYRPDIVFHAAAHKHVPLMEQNPAEAIINNVLGTRTLLDECLAAGVQHFILISTDKAVNPTNIMGASKRVAEMLTWRAAVVSGRPYVVVRFGNVLGSRGSVVPIFKDQIARGGPVTVTHPDIERFFMTIPEAVQLVLQAAALGKGTEVFILDMGNPVKIRDLAGDMIRLSGLEAGRDIEIRYTGLRPGEKLYEELFNGGEVSQRTLHEKIFRANNQVLLQPEGLDAAVDSLIEAAKANDEAGIVAGLHALVPGFTRQAGPPAGERVNFSVS